jgi:hypothetical protein
LSQTIAGYHIGPIALVNGGSYAAPTTLTGTIQAVGGAAVYINSPWSLTIAGAALGSGQYGEIIRVNAFATIENTGTIGQGAFGIDLPVGGDVINQGDITGDQYGLGTFVSGLNGAGFLSVTNAGYIGAQGVGIDAGAGALNNTGTVLATSFGILNLTTVQNAGLIRGREFAGIGLGFGGTVTNAPGASIIGGLDGVYGDADTYNTIFNAGYILGGESHGVEIGVGMVSNASTGTIASGRDAVYFTHPAHFTNVGLVLGVDAGSVGVSLAQGGVVSNAGTITAYTGMVLQGGTLTNMGLIQAETHSNATGLISPGSAGIAIQFLAAGNFIEAAGGSVLGEVLGYHGTLTLEAGTLNQVYGFAYDSFAPGANATLSTALFGFGRVAGFGPGDALVVTGATATSGLFYGHALTLSNATSIGFAGSYGIHAFTVTPGPDATTEITTLCFRAGTRIATVAGEVPVEALRIGDQVRTLHAGAQPVKWIGRRGYAAPFANHADILPIRIRAGAVGRGVPARDLYVSPGHGIFSRGRLIPAARLVNGGSITQLAEVDWVEYYHIELENHDILLAESCPAESFLALDLRNQFHNAAEFARLYPGAPPAAAVLARCERGFGLGPAPCRAGPMRLQVDIPGPDVFAGWAQDLAAPETPVVLDILRAGRRVARVLANAYRADLRRAGIGSGCHAFAVRLPKLPGPFTVRRAGEGDKQAVAFL